jgi:TRAP-type mannitol/chloroaromatic compound transport system substrate-binding protein
MDMRLGLHQAAKYYHYPGWQEPGTFIEFTVNLQAWEALPTDLQVIVETACTECLTWSLAISDIENIKAVKELRQKHKVNLKKFPDSVLKQLHRTTKEVFLEECEKHPAMKPVYDAFRKFQTEMTEWMDISERAYIRAYSL